MRISDWSSDVCSFDLAVATELGAVLVARAAHHVEGIALRVAHERHPADALDRPGRHDHAAALGRHFLDGRIDVIDADIEEPAGPGADRKSTRLNSSH